MYSLNYSAKSGWTLCVDTNLGPIIIKQGTFRNCWNMRVILVFKKNGVYKSYVE